MKKVFIIFLVSVVLLSNNAISKGYSYFDNNTDEKNEVMDIGYWEFISLLIGPDFASKLAIYVDDVVSQNPDSSLQSIYSQTDITNNETGIISNLDVFGFNWDFKVKGKTKNLPTMGYPVLVDRAEDEYGDMIHDISPAYSTSMLYPGYSYFTAYDAMNLYTNNQYSLRLNYNTAMSTSASIGQVSNISFYAMSGLSDPNDTEDIRRAKFNVYVSENGNSWTRIASEKSKIVSSENELYEYYSIDVPSNMIGKDLYVKISFAGQTFRLGFSRLIIDELIITTLN